MKRIRPFMTLSLILMVVLLTFCKEKGKIVEDGSIEGQFVQIDTNTPGLPPLYIPADNPQSAEKISLGKQLFEEKRFSADGTVSCATCHNPNMAFVDRRPVSRGIRNLNGTRNAPTVINATFYQTQFWDGRRKNLEDQARDPLLNAVEHGLKSHEDVLRIIRGDENYLNQFNRVYGISNDQITIDHVVKAIASFERTIISGNSPFDRYLYKGEKGALSPAAIRGMEVYRGKGRCQECHMIGETASIFTDNKFHNLGIGITRYEPKLQQIVDEFKKMKESGSNIDSAILSNEEISELGRYAVTLQISDVGAFKTPTLRNIAKTAPYMHDGSLKTLEAVVDHYVKGGNPNPFLSGSILKLDLTTREKKDLVEFMKSLTSPEYTNQ